MYCTDPGEVEHSTRLISDPVLLVGTTIQYTCNPGFVLEGSSLLTCYSRETGTPIWTSRLPHCVCKSGCSLLLPCSPAPLWGCWVALFCSQDPAQLWGWCRSLSYLEAEWSESLGASSLPPGSFSSSAAQALSSPWMCFTPFQLRSHWPVITQDCQKTGTRFFISASTCQESP